MRKERRFSAAKRISRVRAGRLAHATCGEIRQFFAVSNGLLAGGGSTERTSRHAPAAQLQRAEAQARARQPAFVQGRR